MYFCGMKQQVKVNLPTEWGDFKIIAYADDQNDRLPCLAMLSKKLDTSGSVLVRIHSECLTGDIFHSKKCDCKDQLHKALELISKKGGILIYLRQEGRGIGLLNKLKAYELQEQGFNTLDANIELGFDVDERTFETAVMILKDLNIQNVKLLTNNPNKIDSLKDSGIRVVERVPLIISSNPENESYLQAKKDLMGHLLGG